MSIELKVPSVGESISEVQIGQWLKSEGDWADKDEPLVEIESEKATVELPAPRAGILSKVLKQKGEAATPGEVIGYLDEGQGKQAGRPQQDEREAGEEKKKKKKDKDKEKQKAKEKERQESPQREAEAESRDREPRGPEPAPRQARSTEEVQAAAAAEQRSEQSQPRVMPAARRVLAEHGLEAGQIEATGPGGRLLKEDVERHVKRSVERREPEPARAPPSREPRPSETGEDEVVPMSPLRRRVAERLVEAQQTAALLTTFNEIDMSAVMSLRQQHRDSFQEKHGVKLGIMSFFVKASIEALKLVPQVNAEVRGTDIVYHKYYDIGIAVGGGKGLVVPVLRGPDRMSFAEIELAINDLAGRARDNKLKIEELTGGTFTISNGGVYGSLLSTPIVNPPQSGILGLHAIQQRPVVRDGQVVARPMMYVALTYDHRLVDGREAVLFLRHIKECIEEPPRMLLEI